MGAAGWTIALINATLLVALANAGCPMRPTSAQTSAPRTPGDGGYKIMSSGRTGKYVPDTIYAIGLRGKELHK